MQAFGIGVYTCSCVGGMRAVGIPSELMVKVCRGGAGVVGGCDRAVSDVPGANTAGRKGGRKGGGERGRER